MTRSLNIEPFQANDPVDHGAKARILEAAISLFAEHGYSATSVREIVAAAGVTKPVLYYYFGSKEGLFESILDQADELHRELTKKVLEIRGTTRQRLSKFYRYTMDKASEYQDLVRFMHAVSYGPSFGKLEGRLNKFTRRILKTIETIYQEGVDQGEVIDADRQSVSFLIMSILDFGVSMALTNPEMCRPERSLAMLELAFKGLENKGK